MSKGILQLALSGKVSLQLEYRELEPGLRNLEDHAELGDIDAMIEHVCSFTTTFDSLYAEN